jgi:predicted P-loop ATPase
MDNKQLNTKPSSTNAKKPRILEIESFLTSRYDFRINSVTQKIESRKPGSDDSFLQLEENNLIFELYEFGFTKFKDELKALLGSSRVTRFDPFFHYFNGLPKWKHTDPDYITELASYLKTENQDWWEYMFKKHLVRCVAQAIGESGFNKQCLTLVGKQNDGKTRFLDFLTPPALSEYTRKGFDFGKKEGLFSLVQNFIINLDELASFEKRELNNEFKSVLSESSIRYTPKFANYEATFQRRASFVASTNQVEFLTDETGNVRWLPFIVISINHDHGGAKGYAKLNINKVWSQAYGLLKSGFQHQLTAPEIDQQEHINKRFTKVSDEMEVICRYLKPAEKGGYNTEFMTSTQIKEYLSTKTSIRLYSNQIGKALTSLGFTRISNYDSKKVWVKGYYVQTI